MHLVLIFFFFISCTGLKMIQFILFLRSATRWRSMTRSLPQDDVPSVSKFLFFSSVCGNISNYRRVTLCHLVTFLRKTEVSAKTCQGLNVIPMSERRKWFASTKLWGISWGYFIVTCQVLKKGDLPINLTRMHTHFSQHTLQDQRNSPCQSTDGKTFSFFHCLARWWSFWLERRSKGETKKWIDSRS